MKYSVHLIDSKGLGSYLSVRGRIEWKTLRTARRHANDIRSLIAAGKTVFDVVTVDVEDQFGQIVSKP